MNVTSRRMMAYWNWLGSDDLALFVDGHGVLWKFRATGPTADRALDAQLEAGELVITRSGPVEDAVDVLAHDGVVDFMHVPVASGAARSRVSMPEDLDFDEAGATTSRRDGVVEVRVPLARAKVAETPTEVVAEQAVLLSA